MSRTRQEEFEDGLAQVVRLWREKGESAAIALAVELERCPLVLDRIRLLRKAKDVIDSG